MRDSFEMIESGEHYEDILSRTGEKKLILRFLRSPTELQGNSGRISGVTLQKMALTGEAKKQGAIESQKEDESVLRDYKCDCLVKSIGYKSLMMDGVPFDHRKSVIPHEFGCVKDPESGELDIGLYVAGWIKRGPVGIVDATLRDSMETFRMLRHHLENDMIAEKTGTIEET